MANDNLGAPEDGRPLRAGLSQQAAEPEVSALRASIPDAELGPEATRLRDRLVEKRTTHLHCDWGPEGLKMTGEERAAVLNSVFDEMDHPLTGLAGLLEGEAFCKRDTIMCTRNRSGIVDGEWQAIPPSKDEESLLRSLESAAKTLEMAGRRLREIAAQGTEARRAETGTGSVHDGPVPHGCATTSPATLTKEGGNRG